MADRRPNILYIMSDDHAANAISCYGSRLAEIAPTPNIDRIAREGVRLDHCFCTNSICTPSRAVILTGQHSHVNGVYTLRDDFDPDHLTVARLLQEAGYATAIVGKWHLHTEPQGFDYYNVLPGQGLYFNPRLKEKGKEWQDLNKGGEVYEGYVTDVITDLSLDWLKNRDRSKPFFLMCHHKAPHGAWQYPPRHEDVFDGVEIPEPDSLWEDKSHRSVATRDLGTGMLELAERMDGTDPRPKEWPTGKLDTTGMNANEKRKAAYQKYLKDYLRCVRAIDENVGRLLDYLDKEGLAEDTVVIYTSDQGMFLGEHDYYDKRWIFEESLQMPFVVRHPAEIPAGTTNRDIVLNLDFAPLFLDYAGRKTHPEMQGRSFRANLAGSTPSDWRESMYYRYWMHMASHRNPAHYGIRTQRYKLIFFYGLPLDASGAMPDPTPAAWELYDLEKDPFELKNVYEDPAYADVIKDLRDQLDKLKEECGDTDEKYPELIELRKQHDG
ncbi:MAG: sulfatase [Planctomycetes bacterium]|nr:sulfatase [Planctomycetota bacterium]